KPVDRKKNHSTLKQQRQEAVGPGARGREWRDVGRGRVNWPGLGESVQSEEAGRVDGPVVAIDFQVQMRAGRATGGTHSGNLFALSDQIALLHHQLLGMSITGLVAVAVSDLDHVAIGAPATGV